MSGRSAYKSERTDGGAVNVDVVDVVAAAAVVVAVSEEAVLVVVVGGDDGDYVGAVES